MSGSQLPEGYDELERFVDHWAVDNINDRVAARSVLEMPQIREFYDAIVPRCEQALDHLDAVGLDNMSPRDERLMQLVLALGQAAVAVEVHRAARAPGTTYPHGVRLERGPDYFG